MDVCSLHQRLLHVDGGIALVSGSELRTPAGIIIPGIRRITVEGNPGEPWVAHVELYVAFGRPLYGAAPRDAEPMP